MIMRIKALRMELGMDEVSLGTQMGVGQSTVSMWESEAALPKVRQLPKLADVLQVPIGELFVPYNDTTPRKGDSPCQITTETSTKQPVSQQV